MLVRTRETNEYLGQDINPIITIISIFGIFLILIADVGIWAVGWPSKPIKLVFAILIISLTVFFLVATILVIVGWNIALDVSSSSSSCRDYEILNEPDKKVIESSKHLCDEACPCNIKDPHMRKHKKHEPWGARRIQDCPCDDPFDRIDYTTTPWHSGEQWCYVLKTDFNRTYITEDNTWLQFNMQLEDKFGCSGFCEKSDKFLFTDINHGKPKEACIQALYEDWEPHLRFAIYGGVIVCLWYLLISFLALRSFCYHTYQQLDDVVTVEMKQVGSGVQGNVLNF